MEHYVPPSECARLGPRRPRCSEPAGASRQLVSRTNSLAPQPLNLPPLSAERSRPTDSRSPPDLARDNVWHKPGMCAFLYGRPRAPLVVVRGQPRGAAVTEACFCDPIFRDSTSENHQGEQQQRHRQDDKQPAAPRYQQRRVERSQQHWRCLEQFRAVQFGSLEQFRTI